MHAINAVRHEPTAWICEKATKAQESKTTEKTQAVWQRFAAVAAIAAGVATLVLTFARVIPLPVVGMALSVAFIGGGILLLVISLLADRKEPLDYTDEKALKAYREEAKTAALGKTVDKHGWENLFHYEIVTPPDFAKKYGEWIKEGALSEVVERHDKAVKAYGKVVNTEGVKIAEYAIPNLSSRKPSLLNQIRSLEPYNLSNFVFGYDFKLLEQYGVLSEKEVRGVGHLEARLFDAVAPFIYVSINKNEQYYKTSFRTFKTLRRELANKELTEMLSAIAIAASQIDTMKQQAQQLAGAERDVANFDLLFLREEQQVLSTHPKLKDYRQRRLDLSLDEIGQIYDEVLVAIMKQVRKKAHEQLDTLLKPHHCAALNKAIADYKADMGV